LRAEEEEGEEEVNEPGFKSKLCCSSCFCDVLEANPAKSGWLERLPSRRNLGIFFLMCETFSSATV